MVRTTTGDDNAPEKKTAKPKVSAEDKKVANVLELDDDTWARVQAQANAQSKAPADVIRQAMTQVYGADNPHGAVNSGNETDPRLQ